MLILYLLVKFPSLYHISIISYRPYNYFNFTADFLYKIHYKLDIAIFKHSFDIRAGFFHVLYSFPMINTYTKFYIDGSYVYNAYIWAYEINTCYYIYDN